MIELTSNPDMSLGAVHTALTTTKLRNASVMVSIARQTMNDRATATSMEETLLVKIYVSIVCIPLSKTKAKKLCGGTTSITFIKNVLTSSQDSAPEWDTKKLVCATKTP